MRKKTQLYLTRVVFHTRQFFTLDSFIIAVLFSESGHECFLTVYVNKTLLYLTHAVFTLYSIIIAVLFSESFTVHNIVHFKPQEGEVATLLKI